VERGQPYLQGLPHGFTLLGNGADGTDFRINLCSC
jgi:hypothetical protein